MIIQKERITIEDTMDKLVEKEVGITCGCENPNLKMVMHLDMTDCYQNNYVCDCGNQICCVIQRDEEDKAYWEEGGTSD